MMMQNILHGCNMERNMQSREENREEKKNEVWNYERKEM